jgi:hypothetical protein
MYMKRVLAEGETGGEIISERLGKVMRHKSTYCKLDRINAPSIAFVFPRPLVSRSEFLQNEL